MEVQKIKVNNNFARKVRRSGGKSKTDAIARADASVEKKKPKYHEWIADYMMKLESLFAEAEASPAFDPKTFDAAYLKAAHIRNLGSTFGHEMATAVADRLCELLYRLTDLGFHHGPAISTIFNALKLVTTKDEFNGASTGVYIGFLDELDKVINLFPMVADNGGDQSAKSQKIVH